MMMDEGPQGPTDWEIDMGDIKCASLRCATFASWLCATWDVARRCHKPGTCMQFTISHMHPLAQASWQFCCSVPRHVMVSGCRIVKRPDGTDWELGTGNFGKVLRGIRDDVQPVAVKSMFRRDRAMEEAFIREIAMMKCAGLRDPISVLCT
jgi:hypothetical protein